MILQVVLPNSSASVIGIIAVLLVLINVISLGAFALDKQKSIEHKWRIPEKTLLFLAAIGGAAGALLGMKLFRHKTRHPRFSIGVPVLLILQVFAAVLLIILFS